MVRPVPRTSRESFDHRKLEVYHLATEFFRSAYVLAKRIPRDDLFMRQQFLRAALSIQLNIAEGSGEFRPKEKAGFYRMARRSADECSGLLEDLEFVLKVDQNEFEPHYKVLRRIVTMLIKLIRRMEARIPVKKKKTK